MLEWFCTFLCIQTADLGLDIGAQGEPLGYRPDGKSSPLPWAQLWLAEVKSFAVLLGKPVCDFTLQGGWWGAAT